jgi:hypothetical protein
VTPLLKGARLETAYMLFWPAAEFGGGFWRQTDNRMFFAKQGVPFEKRYGWD